jgi:hypothetical protein
LEAEKSHAADWRADVEHVVAAVSLGCSPHSMSVMSAPVISSSPDAPRASWKRTRKRLGVLPPLVSRRSLPEARSYG